MDSGLPLPVEDFVRVRTAVDLAAANVKLRRFWDYTQTCRDGDGLPRRNRFDPIDIPGLLANIWIMDADVAGRELSYRLVGTHVVMTIGFDPTGRRLSEVMAGSIARVPTLLDRYWFCARTGIATWRRGPARHWKTMEYTEVENLCVPFEGAAHGGAQMIGISVCYRADGSEY